MVEVALLFGRIVLVALLYLFLFAAIKTGIGIVGARQTGAVKGLAIRVTRGPREITGVTIPITGSVIIGRSPDADLVIADDFVSSIHAKVVPTDGGAILEDLGSTNGTIVNGQPATRPLELREGAVIQLGKNRLKVVRA
jgi:pSer/pThr/pTyr-binding forkhead associated (FHA) protein